jgi:hypothetical protein
MDTRTGAKSPAGGFVRAVLPAEKNGNNPGKPIVVYQREEWRKAGPFPRTCEVLNR